MRLNSASRRKKSPRKDETANTFPPQRRSRPRRISRALVYGFSFYFVDFDVGRLWSGLPKLAHWAAKAWPPDTSELGVLIERAIKTVTMAVVGTTILGV